MIKSAAAAVDLDMQLDFFGLFLDALLAKRNMHFSGSDIARDLTIGSVYAHLSSHSVMRMHCRSCTRAVGLFRGKTCFRLPDEETYPCTFLSLHVLSRLKARNMLIWKLGFRAGCGEMG